MDKPPVAADKPPAAAAANNVVNLPAASLQVVVIAPKVSVVVNPPAARGSAVAVIPPAVNVAVNPPPAAAAGSACGAAEVLPLTVFIFIWLIGLLLLLNWCLK